MILAPDTVEHLAEVVRVHSRVLAVGARTKPRLSEVGDDWSLISTAKLTGITEYEPDEFTFTALAGTPVREIASALAEKGQYLPFDPMLADAGATIGGTVAAGLAGPGRHRYGGIRDFILGVRFVDGNGRLLRVGGKVVKNAAGFDLPKFFTGSLGRFGVLAELTFKVFPRAASVRTIKIPVGDIDEACRIFAALGAGRWEAEAVDLPPHGEYVIARLAAPGAALDALTSEITRKLGGSVKDQSVAAETWKNLCAFKWAHADGELLKVATSPAALPEVDRAVRAIADARMHVSAAGNVAFVSLPPGTNNWSVPSLKLRGSGALFPGAKPQPGITAAVKKALDPRGKFPSLED